MSRRVEHVPRPPPPPPPFAVNASGKKTVVTAYHPIGLRPPPDHIFAPVVLDANNISRLMCHETKTKLTPPDIDLVSFIADFFDKAGASQVVIVLSPDILRNRHGEVRSGLRKYHFRGDVICVPTVSQHRRNGCPPPLSKMHRCGAPESSSSEKATPLAKKDSAMGRISKLFEIEEADLNEVHCKVLAKIDSLFHGPCASTQTAAGRQILKLDDLIAVWEAERLGGCVVSKDQFRDLVRFDPEATRFLDFNRISPP